MSESALFDSITCDIHGSISGVSCSLMSRDGKEIDRERGPLKFTCLPIKCLSLFAKIGRLTDKILTHHCT